MVAILFRFGLFPFVCSFVDEYVLGFLDGLLFVEKHALEKAMWKLRFGTAVAEYRLRPETQLAYLKGKVIDRV